MKEIVSSAKIINATVTMNDTFYIIINPPEIDHIILTDSPGGSELTTVTLGVGEQVTAYASGYNSTGEYVGLVGFHRILYLFGGDPLIEGIIPFHTEFFGMFIPIGGFILIAGGILGLFPMLSGLKKRE